MTNKLNIIITLFLLILISACSKDSENFEPNINQESLTKLFDEIQDFQESTTFDATQPFDIVTENRTIISIPGGILIDGSGTEVSGIVEVEYIEILDKSLMAVYHLETESEDKLLESNFNYHLKFTQNGNDLVLEPNAKVIFRVPFDDVPADHYRFYGNNTNEVLSWDLDGNYNGGNIDADLINYTDWVYEDISGQNWSDFGYQFTVDRLGWISISSYYGNDALENTNICVEIPDEIGSANTKAFIIYKNLNSVQELKFNSDNSLFCENLGLTPLNEEVTIISISALADENYYLGMKEVIAGEQESFNIILQKRSKEEILDILGML